MTTTKLRAAGYCRVSTPGQATEDKESLPAQRKQIENHDRLKGWELVNIYEDAGITGKTADRPGLQALLNAVRKKEVDAVIVFDLSRFGRSARDLLNNIELLKDCGVGFNSLKEPIELKRDNDPCSTFLFNVLSSVAELEHAMIYGRMNDAKTSMWRTKRIYNGSLSLGYRWNKESHAIETIPEEAAIYERIVTEYLALGKSIKDIAIGLSKDAVPTRFGRKDWAGATVTQILRCPIYYGICTVNTKKMDAKGKRLGDKPASEHIVYTAPALITKARWDELQVRLDSARQQRSGRPLVGASQFLLYNMLRCGECGAKVVPRWGVKRRDGSSPRYYGCHWRTCGKKSLQVAGREPCTLPIIPAEQLEKFIYYSHLNDAHGLESRQVLYPGS